MQTVTLSPEAIVEYLDEKFPGDGRISGEEYMLPSIFGDDNSRSDGQRKFTINIYSGLWQDFRADDDRDSRGNFIRLYARLEDISYSRARTAILIKLGLKTYFDDDYSLYKRKLRVQEYDFQFHPVGPQSIGATHPLERKCYDILTERRLLDEKDRPDAYFYCEDEPKENTLSFKNRLIIPYRVEDDIFYFIGRELAGQVPKYIYPPSLYGVGKSNLLYPYNHECPSLVICEGPINAISFQRQGINATALGGTSVSDTQIKELREFNGAIILALDTDKAGEQGVKRFDTMCEKYRMALPSTCFAPEGEDWNDLHMSGEDLEYYICNNMQHVNWFHKNLRRLSDLKW